LATRRAIYETVRSLIGVQVIDLVETSKAQIANVAPSSVEAVRRHSMALIAFSESMRADLKTLKDFLMQNLYRHYRVVRMSNKADRIVRELFEAFMNNPRLLPPAALDDTDVRATDEQRAQKVADYIAGMTDRYAIAEYGRIFTAGELT
jgi:dGTPase